MQSINQQKDGRLRAFVVGCPRSGTTLVQSRLSAHPDVYSFPETQLFQQLIGLQRRLSGLGAGRSTRDKFVDAVREAMLLIGWGRRVSPRYRERLKEIGEHIQSRAFADFDFPRTRRLATLIRLATDLFDRAAANAGCRGWIEKSPTHLRYIDFIQRHVRQPRIVHVLRDGRATVASIWEAVERDYPYWRSNFPSVEACATVWNSDLHRSLRYQKKSGHYLLNYHRFCESPEAYCRDVWRFFDLDTNGVETTGPDTTRQVVLPYEEWKKAVGATVEDYGLKKFESFFPATVQKKIEASLTNGGDVSHLGNPAEAPDSALS